MKTISNSKKERRKMSKRLARWNYFLMKTMKKRNNYSKMKSKKMTNNPIKIHQLISNCLIG